MDRVEVGGLTIAYTRVGSGPPLALLHGGLGDHRVWRPQLEALADTFTLVAWDAPGCGGSSDPPDTFRLGDYADVLAGFLRALGLDRPSVLGLSFGGGLALELYRRHPELPGALLLASAYAGWAGSLPQEEVRSRVARAVRDAERPPEEWVDSYVPSMFADAVTPDVVDEMVAMMLDTRPAGMVPMLRAFAEADLRDVLPLIQVPTLLLYGDADVRSPPAVAEALHERIPTSELVVLPGVGHVSNLEAPEVFNRAVRDFLAGV